MKKFQSMFTFDETLILKLKLLPLFMFFFRIYLIFRAILSMDTNEQLPIDMVEQLLKFTPSAEERALLDEHSEDIDSLARADRFLYEISK